MQPILQNKQEGAALNQGPMVHIRSGNCEHQQVRGQPLEVKEEFTSPPHFSYFKQPLLDDQGTMVSTDRGSGEHQAQEVKEKFTPPPYFHIFKQPLLDNQAMTSTGSGNGAHAKDVVKKRGG